MDLSKPISLDEADAALTTLHDSMALLKCFVAQQERKVLQKTNQLPMSSAPIHLHRELVFDAVLQWIRTVLDDATNGELFPLFPGCPPEELEDEAIGQEEGALLGRRPTSSSSQGGGGGGGSAAAAAMMFNGGGAGAATATTNNHTTAGSNNSRPPTASRVPSAATTTTAVGATPHVEPTRVSSSSSQHPHRPHHANRSIAHLATLTHLLTQQLEAERRNKHFYVSASTSFNRILEGYREENAAIAAYKDRIVELQAVLNDTKKVGEVGALVGPPTNTAPKHAVASSGGGSAAAAAVTSPLVVPVDCIPSDEQKRREVANALAAVTIHMKDKWERTNAECSVLLSEKAYLMTESRLLLDRVKVLEAQLSVVTASASACLRELQKARSQEAQRSQQLYRAQNSHIAPSPHIVQERLSAVTTTASTSTLLPAASRVESSSVVTADGGPTCVIGGVTMEVSVALWLRDVYVSLMANPDAAGVLQLLRHPNHNSSSVQAAAAATPTTGSMSGPPTRQGSAAAERGGGGGGVPSASSSAPPRPGSGAAAAGVPLGASTSSRGGSAGGRGGSLTMIEAGSEAAADGGDLGPTTTPTSGAVGRPSSSSSFVDHVRQVRASRGSSADTERTTAD